jgi:hypothetical protein
MPALKFKEEFTYQLLVGLYGTDTMLWPREKAILPYMTQMMIESDHRKASTAKTRTGTLVLGKRQTIRKQRKNELNPGDRVSIYTVTNRGDIKIGEVNLTMVQPIILTPIEALFPIQYDEEIEPEWMGMGSVTDEELAHQSGFPSYDALTRFYAGNYELPFEGMIIRW